MDATRRAGGPARAQRPGARAPDARPDLDLEAELAHLSRLAALLDTRFRIPLTPIRFGLDPILGLIPGLGDFAAALPAAYFVWRAHRIGAPRPLVRRMAANVALDFAVGSIPVAGSVWDVFFRASKRNLALLRAHLEAR